ncbi:unnamed protein product, partial [Meganyctiphanes norvegica]
MANINTSKGVNKPTLISNEDLLQSTELDREKWRQPNHKKNEMFPSLHWTELLFYFIAFYCGAIYSLYILFITSQRWVQYLPVTYVNDSMFGSHQDETDTEWYVWSPIIVNFVIPWGILHVLLAQLIRRFTPQYLCLFYILFSVCLLIPFLSLVGTILCFIVPLLMYVVLISRLKLLIYLAWCLLLILYNTQLVANSLEWCLEEVPNGDYKVSLITGWIMLRSLSFSLEVCDADPEAKLTHLPLLTTLLAYCLYMPLVFYGPFMPFTDFQKGISQPYKEWTIQRTGYFILQFFRFFWWIGITHILLFYFYGHSFYFSPYLVKEMTSWSMAGFVYYLNVFLLLKYVVLYGLPSVLARMEGFDPPLPPKCILLTYRFSDIWRYFDHGIYRFMIKYIYIPWVGSNKSMLKQVQGSALVFIFVYVWHGVSLQIFVWSFINFIGILIEKIADYVLHIPQYKDWEKRWVSDTWRRRIYGLGAVFLYIPSLVAITVFNSNLENGAIVAERIFISGYPDSTVTTFFFVYCSGQMSMELQNWRIKTKLKNQS